MTDEENENELYDERYAIVLHDFPPAVAGKVAYEALMRWKKNHDTGHSDKKTG